jgi:trehalose/maltose transport system substrate-binding protein
MAARIQQGERAKGGKKFGGFVWPGAAGEGLTCNALEWQMSEGDGRVIEADSTISVNNRGTILALQRAKHWIGWISPPGVISDEEWDAVNAFYQGRAAFFRGWALAYFLSIENRPELRDRIGITNVPGDRAGRAATLGGFGLGVSRTTAHPAEALKLVQFLVRREKQFEATRWHADPTNSDFAVVREYQQGGTVLSRPSAIAGQRYEDVDHSYIRAVHSVLMGKIGAPEAVASLEKELVGITGFKTGPPSRMGAAQLRERKIGSLDATEPLDGERAMACVPK